MDVDIYSLDMYVVDHRVVLAHLEGVDYRNVVILGSI